MKPPYFSLAVDVLIFFFKVLTHLLQQPQLIVALGFRTRKAHHAQSSRRNAPPRSPTLALRLRELDGAQRLPCLAARIVDDFAIIVEEHRRATFGVVRRPIRQAFVVRVPSSREGN